MRLHPLTVPYRVVSRGLGVAWAVLVGGIALSQGEAVASSLVVLAVLLAVVAGVAYEVAWYRRFDYELTSDSLDIRSGVFSRREREIPLRRVQNVDVTRSFVARLLGLAAVDVETAGGGQTEASLQYVSAEEARRLQDGLRERRAAIRREDAGEEAEAAAKAAAEPGGETLFELSDRDLLLYGALGFDPRLLSGVFAVAPFVAPALAPLFGDDPSLQALGLAAAAVLLVLGALAVWAASAVLRVVQFYGFRLRRVGNELRYERGLLQRYDGTIPLGKLQTVTVEENVLMRRYGFASLGVETAGYAPGSSPRGGSEAAVPIAPLEDVLALARSLEEFDDWDLERPPERARKRYVRRYALAGLAVLVVAYAVSRFAVTFPWYALAPLLALAFPAARLAHANRGYDLGADHAVTQAGFWRRQTRVVPYYRVQTVIRSQNVFQRRWRLATTTFDTAGSRSLTGGDAAAVDVDADDADRIVDEVEDRVLAAVQERRSDDGAAGGAGTPDGDDDQLTG